MPRHGCRAAALRAAWRLAFGVASAFASDVGGNALVLAWSAAARAEWLLDVDAGARYDSNLTRAQERPDVRSDAAATLFASAGTFFALTGADGLTLDINALTEAWHRFHGLGSASYKHKFGLGYAAPWMSLGLAGSATRDERGGDAKDHRCLARSSNRGFVDGQAQAGSAGASGADCRSRRNQILKRKGAGVVWRRQKIDLRPRSLSVPCDESWPERACPLATADAESRARAARPCAAQQ